MSHHEAINKAAHTLDVAINEQKIDDIVSHFTTDGILMLPHFPASKGQDAIKAFVTQLAAMANSEVHSTVVEIKELSDSLVQVQMLREGKRTLKATGAELPVKEQGLALMKKVDGEWKVLSAVANDLTPPPSA